MRFSILKPSAFRDKCTSMTKKMVEVTMKITAVKRIVDFQTSSLRFKMFSRMETRTRIPLKAAEIVTARMAFFKRWLRS